MHASAYQLAERSSTLQRAREGCEARFLTKAIGEIRRHGRRTADENISGSTHRRGTDRVVHNSSTGCMRVSFPAKAVLSDLPLKQERAIVTLQLVVNTGNILIMSVASLEDRIFRTLVALGERIRKMDATRDAHGHEESVLPSNQALSRAVDGLPEHEQSQIPKSSQ